MRTLLALVLVVVATGCGQAIPDEALIVPGRRIGAIRIGHDTQGSLLGDPPERRRSELREQGIELSFDRGGPVSSITAFSPDYATAEGLRVGCSVQDVEAQLGVPLHRSDGRGGKFLDPRIAYDGVIFHHFRGRVRGITVTDQSN